jgi:uncharacterized protein
MIDLELEELLKVSETRIKNTNSTIVRPLYHTIEWNSKLILLKGCRGVGKTYLMLQYLKLSEKKSAFFSLDNLYFLTTSISKVINNLYNEGFRLFALGEIHKYPNWSIELKNIYDNYHDIKVLVTSSSALDVMSGSGDLSRRMDTYILKGLTFTEYCLFEYNEHLPTFTFEELLKNHAEIYNSYFEAHDLNKKFNNYLKKGYYPYYKEAGNKYHDRLLSVILQVVDTDMAAILNVNYESIRQVKKLLALISRLGPFCPNVSKLSRDLSMSRNSVLNYLDFLSEAGIINVLKSSAKSDSVLAKPEKIFFENANLLYAFDANMVNSGTLRETFVFNALKTKYEIHTPIKGDFLLDKTYTIEVGGPNKNFHQLDGMANGILIKDGIAEGSKDVLPMWMLGLL